MKIYIAKIKFKITDIWLLTELWAYSQVKVFKEKEDAETWAKAQAMADDVIEIEEVII